MKYLLLICFLIFNQLLYAANWISINQYNSELRNDFILSFTIDNNNIKWLCTDSSIMSFDGVNFKSYSPSKIVNTSDTLFCISSALDSSGNLWFLYSNAHTIYSRFNSGLLKYDGQDFKVYPIPEKYSKGHAWTMEIDKNNKKWISLIDYGLLVFNDTLWTAINKDNSQIFSAQISSMSVDSENRIWMGSVDSGFAIYDKGNWKKHNTKNSELPSNDIYDIKLADDNTAWIATAKGLVKFDSNDMTIFTGKDMGIDDGNDIVSTIQVESNILWVGMLYDYNAFLEYDGENWEIFNPLLSTGLELRYPKKIEIDRYGNKWIGMYYDGIAVYNENGVVLGVNDLNSPINGNINAFPNPFADRTTIKYNLEQASNVKLTVYNSLGQQVAILINEFQEKGTQEAVFNSSILASGVYYFILQTGNKIQSGRLMLIK